MNAIVDKTFTALSKNGLINMTFMPHRFPKFLPNVPCTQLGNDQIAHFTYLSVLSADTLIL